VVKKSKREKDAELAEAKRREEEEQAAKVHLVFSPSVITV
jgi:hypothetical protein